MTDQITEALDDLMDQFVFELLDERQAGRVRQKIEQDPLWQLAYEAAIRRKQALAASVRSARSAAGPSTRGESAIADARRIESRQGRARRITLWSAGATAAAAAVVIAAMWIHAASIRPTDTVLRLLGQTQLAGGSTASLRAMVATLTGQPKAGVPVTFVLRGLPGGERVLGKFISDAAGSAAGEVKLPDIQGEATLVAFTDDNAFSQVDAPIKIERACRVYLSTDKPIYQPGQAIHIRCLVLRKPQMAPDAGGAVELSVTDPAGNVIFKHAGALSDYGLAWADLPLDELVSPGRYTVKATAGADASEQTVEVFHYKLPAFAVKLSLDKPYYLPGQTMAGKVDVQYHFGKPVAEGKVELELIDRTVASPHAIKKLTLATDSAGKAGFEIELPRTLFGQAKSHGQASLLLTATVIDSAGQENTGYLAAPVAQSDIRLAVVAENGSAAPGLPARLYIVASYPDGRPAKAVLDIQSIGQSIRTDDAGAAVVDFQSLPAMLMVTARDERGRTGSTQFTPAQAQGEALVLRTDKPIYTGGQTMNVEVLSGNAGEVFIDIVKDRQTVLTKSLAVVNGRGTAGIDLPAELSGTLTLHAYRLGDDGEWVGRDLLIVVRPSGTLKVGVTSDKGEYRPGGNARLDLVVTDPTGKPIPAALSVAAVDEAVYSVQQAAPGLEGLLAGLDEAILTPAIEVHGFSPALMDKDDDYARAVLAAAVPPTKPKQQGAIDRLIRQNLISPQTVERLRKMDRAQAMAMLERNRMLRDGIGQEILGELFGTSAGRLDRSNKFSAEMNFAAAKRVAEHRAGTVTGIGIPVGLLAIIVLIAAAFWRPVATILATVMVAMLLVATMLPTLGRAREMTRRAVAENDVQALALASVLAEAKSEAIGQRGPAPVAPEAPMGELEKGEPGAPAARTRTFFPETMLWRPQVITDEHGKARLEIPLADSITTWRLSGAAVAKSGQLGRIESAIRVFQPFFVDINAPLTLTQGDEVSVPLVVYNYTNGDLDVTLKPAAADGLSIVEPAAGGASSVRVAPGEVKRQFVRVRADNAGAAALTVDASAGRSSDSIRRSITIVPPGRPASLAVNGQIGEGQQVVEIPLPADAVPGSIALQFKLYPSTFSELVEGLENIFRMPNGCFEQTSSTTYPNVMALSYLKANRIDKPEIVAKATNYIQLGYQRLVSFEVSGGGFDWFGHPPANVVLTAYGLMEFSDMAKVHNVDSRLLSRTAAWLASQQDGQGAWSFASGCFHEPFTGGDNGPLATTAYVTWAMASYDPACESAKKGAAYIEQHAAEARSAWTIALCANALLTQDISSMAGAAMLRQLAAMAVAEGKDQKRWGGSSANGGSMRFTRPDEVTPTALAVLALSRKAEYAPLATDGMRWLCAHKDPQGTWGTTQGTVLALKALLAGSGAAGKRDAEATVAIVPADGGDASPLARLTVPTDKSDIVHSIRVPMGQQAAGTLRLAIQPSKAAGMGFQFALRYHTMAPSGPGAPGERPLDIQVSYDRTKLEVNQTLHVIATVRNASGQTANMLLADIGTPPGFSVDPAGLDKLRAAGKIDRYTLTARGVIVYITSLPAGGSLDITYALTARMPLVAVAAPTSVYAYYQPQNVASATAARFEVTPGPSR